MSGGWVAAYVILAVSVIVLCVFMVGTLRQVGIIRLELAERHGSAADGVPTVEEDGPPIGAMLPKLAVDTVNGYGTIALDPSQNGARTLLSFLTPTCPGCQDAVRPLNDAAARAGSGVRMVTIMTGRQSPIDGFLSIYPLDMPVVVDTSREVSSTFGVQVSPLALLYNSGGVLVRKANLGNARESLDVLLTNADSEDAEATFPLIIGGGSKQDGGVPTKAGNHNAKMEVRNGRYCEKDE